MAKRWNGWGGESEDHPLGERARGFLASRIGAATPAQSASRETALRAIAPSRLTAATHFVTDPATRLDHAFGQSTPDWIALRSGRVARAADGVALPATHAEAVAALEEAKRLGAIVIPYGGGTSVVGHLRVPVGDRPVVNISLERLAALQSFDATNLVARFGAGAPGPAIEAALAAHGMTLGHFPQSFELSTAGGWVVTRSSGQQSLRYGRIENLFHGGRLATPRGELAVGGLPASSAGPDLREAVLGSEGRLGLLTEVNLRLRPRAAHEAFHAIFFPQWDAGLAAVRALAQAGVALSMLRYANAVETETQLALVEGHDGALAWLGRYLRWRGVRVGAGACMLLAGVTGSEREARQARAALGDIVGAHRGVAVGTMIGKGWAKNRFRGPYLRNSLWDAGICVETMETCVPWSGASAMLAAIEGAGRAALAAQGERVHVFTHLSHVYRQGCSVYSTFVYRLAADPDANLERWRGLKTAVSQAVVAGGGTISHQHGVGVDHAPYLAAEKGELGMALLRAAARELDPGGMMNPGKLWPDAAAVAAA
ncbi:MAG: FAD-binding oxidoreductase [Burkholderiales bacterium]|nr:FAD-binding oxidoreductase [Burkholderiales bacterium]